MTTEEVFNNLATQWMNNRSVARVFGFTQGASFDEVYSKVSIVRLLFYVVASVIALKETKLSEWEEMVRKVAEDTHYGTRSWWRKKALEYEVGKNLEVIDGKVEYREVDEANRIVKAVAVVESGRIIEVKVAKGEIGNLMPLSVEELASFDGYLQTIKPLGLIVRGFSTSANRVSVTGEVAYEGEYVVSDVRDRVELAINDYLKNLEFGGTLYVGRMVGAILKVEGVVNADIEKVEIDGVVVDGSAMLSSGYAVLQGNVLNYKAK